MDRSDAAAPDVRISWGFLNPVTLAATFEELEIPREHDVLKIDIDSFDLDLLEDIYVAGFKLKLLIVEVRGLE